MKGRRLSRRSHCSIGAQPVPKAVYRSGHGDKHNCQRRDSDPGPLTPQSDALTTRLLRLKYPSNASMSWMATVITLAVIGLLPPDIFLR